MSRLNELLNGPKDSSTIHYDEDTIPHGACSDPLHCDCMCPHCWSAKASIIRVGLRSAFEEGFVAGRSRTSAALAWSESATAGITGDQP